MSQQELFLLTVYLCMCLCSLVHSGPDRGSPHSGTELFFATRTGTRLGIETHLFRAETTKDLSVWTRHIVNGCHSSAEMIKEVTTSESGYITRILKYLYNGDYNVQRQEPTESMKSWTEWSEQHRSLCSVFGCFQRSVQACCSQAYP